MLASGLGGSTVSGTRRAGTGYGKTLSSPEINYRVTRQELLAWRKQLSIFASTYTNRSFGHTQNMLHLCGCAEGKSSQTSLPAGLKS